MRAFTSLARMALPVFLLLSESHASLHAWPEYGYCAIDLFTCALGKDLIPLIQEIKTALGADNFSLRKLDRDADVERFSMPAELLHAQEQL